MDIMEPPKVNNNMSNMNKVSPVDKMSSSINSTLEDTTPSDSGVQLLDSENSDVMLESMCSYEESSRPMKVTSPELPSMDPNSNVAPAESMITSDCSTFDTTEKIVYRRKVHKTSSTSKAPKKRVSFHEDILKNTRTDNIHIEHGFITYKNGRKLAFANSAGVAGAPGRYSWCPERDRFEGPNEISAAGRDDDDGEDAMAGGGRGRKRHLVYRNACSDVLDYVNTDMFDTNEPVGLQYDTSGVFEYTPSAQKQAEPVLYNCVCSSSNSSLDSDEQDKNSNSNSNRKQYEQAKSSSCDCIGMSNANNNLIGDNCYYSEPNIGDVDGPTMKSVWNKEKKPKSSCLKKTKRQTNIILEQDLNGRVKTFNVHDIKHQLLDNSSKMIFGSLKSIFTMPLPERGVPEGSEDLQAVAECVPELEHTLETKANRPQESPTLKPKPFLSKSLDGNKQTQSVKKFVHNVDEQLRHKNDDSSVEASPTETKPSHTLQRQEEFDKETAAISSIPNEFRSKFIINCESTVFEHTGVSYETGQPQPEFSSTAQHSSVASLLEQNTPIAEPAANQIKKSFMDAPIAKTFSNFFRSLKESTSAVGTPIEHPEEKAAPDDCAALKMPKPQQQQAPSSCKLYRNHSSSTLSEPTSSTNNSGSHHINQQANNTDRHSRHLPSPLKKHGQPMQPTRYYDQQLLHSRSLHSPNSYLAAHGGGCGGPGGSGRDSKSTILSEEYDDILTITTTDTTNDKRSMDSDLVIIDYTDVDYAHLLKPPAPAAKTSLINRFLRNVTQKKILETSIRKNNFFADKLRNEQRLYVKGARPKNYELIDDLNAEIAMEIEMCGTSSPRRELAVSLDTATPESVSSFELGIGEISIELFHGKSLLNLRDSKEQLLKVFKLYTGYSTEGVMTPVLVLLTDRTLYVADLDRDSLCAKFVLAYKDLDVILMGPFGNTVLLSNSMRDMQQVLLSGGPYPAGSLVANLELCARRSGATLPAVGQLTLEHLAPLQAFVRANSCVGRDERWLFYAVVNVPAVDSLRADSPGEPLGPSIRGFLMHRRLKETATTTAASRVHWQAGYFLLKAGVLYMFNDSTQNLPSWAMALAECQGARRTLKSERPHCFEIMLKGELLQMAAPDEYVASEWLQALLQSATGHLIPQEKHKTLGCTLIVTENHLITLREDFSSPLRPLNHQVDTNVVPQTKQLLCEEELLSVFETSSLMGSTMSTPTRGTQRSFSSLSSTPTKNGNDPEIPKENSSPPGTSQRMSSVYGKNSGLAILTCGDIKAMTGIKITSRTETWWCILEFSCQEAPLESVDDLVIFFASSMEMQRFLRLLEQLWQAKNNDLFPITILDDGDDLAEQCTLLYIETNRAWEPLLSAAMG